MNAPILQLQNISLTIGTQRLFHDVSASIYANSRVCIVGQNGTGKSTLMKIISGLVEPDGGDIFIQAGTKIAYMPQDPVFPKNTTARDYILSEKDVMPHEAEMALDELGINYDKNLDHLSGGEGRRVSLACALALNPDILMLDEPTNHLDVETILWLEKRLQAFQGALILISHDRTFLATVTDQTIWLDQGTARSLNGGYKDFEAWSEAIIEEETKARAKQEKLIAKETEWSRGGISARRKRNQGRLKRLYALREKRASQLNRLKMARLDSKLGETSSRALIEVKDIHKAYGDKPLINGFSTQIMRGDRIGIMGPNGSGKTTLLRLLIGQEKPDRGKVKLGKTLDPLYLDQNRTDLDLKKNLWETLCPNGGDHLMVQDKSKHVVGYLKEFMFKPEQARSPVSTLSGGERNRLLLAKSLATTSNFMILDEPTNDLDMDTLDRLQDMLCEYEGTLLIVSHDRAFLDNVVTSTIVMEGQGQVTEYAGGYSDYLQQAAKHIKKSQNDILPSKQQTKLAENKSNSTNAKLNENNESAVKKRPQKLTFKHQHALKVLPQEIDDLAKRIAIIEDKLSDPDLYKNDSLLAQDLALERESLQAKKEAKENEYLDIELLKEEIENN